MLVLNSCTTEKNTWVNRNFHNVTSRYNGYFHANLNLNNGIDQLERTQEDNLDELIPVFPYGDESSRKSVMAMMDKAIKKATKVIARHSMIHKVKGEKGRKEKRELCNWIDDSYFVIAKAHYFNNDINSALETFQFMKETYDYLPIKYDASIWAIKVLVDKEEYADANVIIEELTNDKEFPKNKMGDYAAVKAEYHIKNEEYSEAVKELQKAVIHLKKKSYKIRFTYLLAQLSEQLGDKDAAVRYYEQVIKMNPPYEYAFNAKINMAKAFSGNDASEIKKVLYKMIKDEKNKEYLDQIYFAIAEIELKEGNREEAMRLYSLSANKSVGNMKQKSISYLKLADLYFKEPDYLNAQAYFDSCVSFLPKDYPDYDKLVDKKNGLTELVNNYKIIDREDSLQRIAKMTEFDRNAFIDNLIENYIIEQEKIKEAQETSDLLTLNDNNTPGFGEGSGEWYFNNPGAISSGRSEFIRIYGSRKLEDNWRRSNKQSSGDFANPDVASSNVSEDGELDFSKDVKANREYYLKNLPLTDSAMGESNNKIIQSLYKLGMVYLEDLNDIPMVIKTFEELVNRFESTTYSKQAYYVLYRMYKQEGNISKSDIYKGKIMSEFPTSDYAKIISNPNYMKEQEELAKEGDRRYKVLFQEFIDGKYEKVAKESELVYNNYKDAPIGPDVFFLMVMANGHLSDDRDAFKKELQEVKARYPKHRVAEDAQTVINRINGQQKMEKNAVIKEKEKTGPFNFNMMDEHYYCINVNSKDFNITELKTNLSDFNNEYFSLLGLKVKSILWNGDYHLVMIMGLPDGTKASQYFKAIRTEEFLKPMLDAGTVHFITSKANYIELSKSKDMEAYLEFFLFSYELGQ